MALAGADDGLVLETHGGTGRIAAEFYAGRPGIAIERDERKAAKRALLLPHWWTILGDCRQVLSSGALRWAAPTVIDVDPYGDPWHAIEAALANTTRPTTTLTIIVTDGLFHALTRGSARITTIGPEIATYGRVWVHRNYEQVARDKLTRLVGGMTLERWAFQLYRRQNGGNQLALYAARFRA